MNSIADIPRIKIVIDDQEAAITGESDWVQWRTYIDNTFSWLASRPKPPLPARSASDQSSPPSDQISPLDAEQVPLQDQIPADVDNENSQPAEAKFSSFPKKPVVGERLIDYLVRALAKLGGNAHKGRTYETMLNDGFITTSAEPARTIHDIVRRKYQSLVSVEGDAFILTDGGWQLAKASSAEMRMWKEGEGSTTQIGGFAHAEQSADKPGKRQNGTDTIDYILRALYELGGEASYEIIVMQMLSYGWQTTSDTLKKQCQTIAATIYDFRHLVEKPGGSIARMTPQGLIRFQEKAKENRSATEAEKFKNGNPTLSLYGSEAGLLSKA